MIVPGGWRAPRVAVVGAGTLGRSAAHAALANGSPVTVLVRDHPGADATAATRAAVADSLQREVRRGALPAARSAAWLDRLSVTSAVEDLAGSELVVEAVPEDLATKQAVIAQIEDQVSPSCVIASATSSIPAGWLAGRAQRPERVIVAHYVWPAHRMPLVEVATHPGTSAAAEASLLSLLAAQGKTVIRVADQPGFLITRALLAYWNEAVELVTEGYDVAEIDGALESFGMPLGPLRLIDNAGIGTACAVHQRLSEAVGERFRALTTLADVVARGLPGFYDRAGRQRRPVHATAEALRRGSVRLSVPGADVEIVGRVIGALAREVDHALSEGVVTTWAEAGRAIDLAYGFPTEHGGLQTYWSRHAAALPLLSAAS